MKITQTENNDFVVVAIDGEIDLDSSPQMRKIFQELMDKGKSRIVIDFEKVSYIDSSGLATLIEMMQRLKKIQGQLSLVQMSDKIRSLFEITKLDKLFSIHRTQAEAFKAI
ncbi:MAG: STAS domain-containing protein [Candidatus Omnitrophota bacterium]